MQRSKFQNRGELFNKDGKLVKADIEKEVNLVIDQILTSK